MAGSAQKYRVGRVIGNTGIFLKPYLDPNRHNNWPLTSGVE